jgi:uncharacterized membrane protein YheB (UPF0754 family)
MESFQEIYQASLEFLKLLWVQIALLVIFATLHGYAGAWLAVRMLFRPRKPVKILGLTVFPQGMIPKHRERLANAIGRAVGEELVSQETLIEELFGKDFLRMRVQKFVDSFADELLARDYPSLIEALPSNIRPAVLDTISSLQLKIGSHVTKVLQSEETVGAINGFVGRRVDEILSKRVSETVDEDTLNEVLNVLETRVRAVMREKIFEEKISDFVNRRIDDLVNTETHLGEMFTQDAVALLKARAAEQIDPLIHQLTELATAERTRNQISALIKHEVHDYYEALPFFKKIFVSREYLLKEVDDLVNETLPKRLEDTLRGDLFAEEAKTFLDNAINNAMSRRLSEFVGKIAPDQLERLKNQITKNVLTILQGNELQQSISAYLSDALYKIRPHSIGAILQTVHPLTEAKLKENLSRGLMKILAEQETSNIVNSVLANQIERLLAAPIGKLSDHISEAQIRDAGKALTETILSAARERLPDVIREFDIGGVVREKINNYPVEKLEGLVLSVAKEHLRTIELFGAFFGFVIGLVQALLSYWAFAK